ncbi:hypothetical protein B296_00035842 [Ensete ventricosum]|uniref:Uncharacterized protein n=1 Tax=Ensete ventricosum TaxID=4639 RepID=A0A426ZY84_ENSVE|nr:hypothetical protein B296_00035842 [Ensete ventricosum]
MEFTRAGGCLGGGSSSLSIVLLGGPKGSPQECFVHGRFWSSCFLATKVSATMYWLALYSISGTVAGGRSTNDKKNLEGRRPIRKAWITNEGCASSLGPRCRGLVGWQRPPPRGTLYSRCYTGALATLGPPSSTENIARLCVVAEESSRLGSAHVRKLVCVVGE